MRQIDFRRVLTSDTDQMLLNRILEITYLETGAGKLIIEVTFLSTRGMLDSRNNYYCLS